MKISTLVSTIPYLESQITGTELPSFLNLYPQVSHKLDLPLHGCCRQTVLGDLWGTEPPYELLLLEDRDIRVAKSSKVRSARDWCRTTPWWNGGVVCKELYSEIMYVILSSPVKRNIYCVALFNQSFSLNVIAIIISIRTFGGWKKKDYVLAT